MGKEFKQRLQRRAIEVISLDALIGNNIRRCRKFVEKRNFTANLACTNRQYGSLRLNLHGCRALYQQIDAVRSFPHLHNLLARFERAANRLIHDQSPVICCQVDQSALG